MIQLLFIYFLTFAQSFPEKPHVPIFDVEGQEVVRVDCWQARKPMVTYLLGKTDHPAIFQKTIFSDSENSYTLEVSRLKTENTLSIIYKSEKVPQLEVVSYGLDCGFQWGDVFMYCSIFDGELADN